MVVFRDKKLGELLSEIDVCERTNEARECRGAAISPAPVIQVVRYLK